MFPEWAAVNLEALQYVVRHIIGWLNYAWLTGTSEEDEVARVRAWDIAIDAQLMGGDSEISGSRLILTILASGTLPRSPARLILKAIHLRILLWKAAGLRRSSVWLLVHRIAASLARYQWRLAQDLDREPVSRSTQPAHDVESLPEHLSALLQLSCAEALTDTITQRAHNLAWSRPTREDVCGTSDEMDLVVEDFTIRSPHDALAAWVSSATLQKALYAKLSNIGHETSELDWDFGIALHTAPPASIAQARALATNAVFVEANRQSALRMLLQDFMSKDKPERFDSAPSHTENTAFIDSSLPKAVRDDVLLATSCAFALGSMRKAGGQRQHLKQALRGVCNGYRDAKALTWLSFGTAYYLIHVVRSAYQANDLYKRELQQISSRLRSWLQVLGTSDCVIDQETVTDIEIRLSSNIVAEKGVSDTLSCDTAQPTEDLTQGRDSTAQPTQGFPAIITEADPALSKTSSFTDLPSLLHENPGVWLPKSKDRRPSHCSEDSGYGSTAA